MIALPVSLALFALVVWLGLRVVRGGRPTYEKLSFWGLLLALPFVLGILASGVGSVLGCSVNEAGTSPCIVGGTDIGETLATLFVMMWLGVFTFPATAILFIVAGAQFLQARWSAAPPLG